MAIHVLHVGKTGGTALRSMLQPFADQGMFVLHDHHVRLSDCPATALTFVVIRHPVARFISGFNSRLRQGRPRYERPWSLQERLAFRLFSTPDQLAQGLGSGFPTTKCAAVLAMHGIRHVNRRLSYWLDDPQRLRDGNRVMIGRTNRLDHDVGRLFERAGIDQVPVLPTGPIVAHVTPARFSTQISDRGRANLTKWFGEDIALYEHCLSLIDAA
jgi:hypothetical protein